MTVYVERGAAGEIKGVYLATQPGYATEAVSDDAAEVVAFRKAIIDAQAAAADPAERKSLKAAAAQAVADNDAFLANSSPSNALVAAQVKALTRQATLLIRRVVQVG